MGHEVLQQMTFADAHVAVSRIHLVETPVPANEFQTAEFIATNTIYTSDDERHVHRVYASVHCSSV